MSVPAATAQGWGTVRLGNIAKTASGGTPRRSVAVYYGGGIPWVKSGELGDSIVYNTEETISQAGLDSSSAKIFPKGTLCIALYGATVGKLGLLGIDAATNQAVCGIFLPDELDTRFAYRFLESKRWDLVKMGKGGAQSNISQEIIRDLQFPLPPIDEQHRIVEEIEKQLTRLEAGVAALKRVRTNLKRYRAAVLKAACEGRLIAGNRTSWRTARLGEAVDILDSRRIPVNREERAKRVGEVPYYGATGQVGWIDSHIFDEELVLLGEDGAPFLESAKPKAYLIREKSWVNNHAHVLRARQGLLNLFLLYQLNCLDYRPYVSGTTRLKLPQGPMKQIPLLVPPLAEQERIVAEVERRLSVVEELEAVVSANLQRATRLRQSILHRAFKGKLVIGAISQ